MTSPGSPKPLPASIVVPTYRRCASVLRLLKALNTQTVPPDQFEVIVSIDGSEDGTREMVENFPSRYALRCLWNKRRGRAGACNSGLRASLGNLVIFLDDDMEPGPNLVAGHLAAHTQDACVGIIGAAPVVFGAGSPPVVQYIGRKFARHLKNLGTPGYRLKFRDFYSGNFSVDRAVLLKCGGFDEDFTFYGNEDLELSLRLTRLGVHLEFSPHALARQHYEKSFASLAQDNIEKGRTAVLLAVKHPETFAYLKLSQPALWWRLPIRNMLLHSSRRLARIPTYAIKLMDRLAVRLPALFIRLCQPALGYFYWLGASRELSDRGITLRFLASQSEAARSVSQSSQPPGQLVL
jgi:GT2 family glycosyltransferase